MTEHHWRDEIKSLLGSHVAPEKTEQLEETKKEIENKANRILKLIKDEGEESNLNIESQLVDLVTEYCKQYKSLNEPHDDHTAELKGTCYYQEGTIFSQYSDSDPSSKEKASGSIKQQIEAANDNGKIFSGDLQAREDQLKDENSTLQDGKEQRIINGLQLDLASLQTQKKELEEQFEEKDLKLQLVQTELRDKILELERISKEKEDNERKLKLQIAGEKKEAEGRNSLAMKKNNELAREVAGLQKALKKSTEKHKQLQDQSQETYLEKLCVKDEMILELGDKILELERISKEKEDNESKLKLQIAREKQEAEGRKSRAMKKNNELAREVASLQKALKESTEEHKQLQNQSNETYLEKLRAKDEMIDTSIELAKKMKQEIIVRTEAIRRLLVEKNTTEYNLRTSNNNLHATEQLLAEEKEVYRKQEEKFEQECKELKEQNSKLSNEIDTAQRDLIEIRSSLEKTRNSFFGLEVVFQEFQENDSSFQSRIVEVSEALRILKNLLMDRNGKIKELEKRLNNKEDEVLKIEEEKK